MSESSLQDKIDQREREETNLVLAEIQTVLKTSAGRNFVRYLFKSFMVGDLPDQGLPEMFLRENLGTFRAGQAIFKIVAAANPEVASAILAQMEKEKYVQSQALAAR